MTYIKAAKVGRWYVGGENATAECLNRDECDWELGSYMTLRQASERAEEHVVETGHTVEVERAQFRTVRPS